MLSLFATGNSVHAIEKRVLFVVETSRETKSLAEAQQKVVGALIQTGLGGLLSSNDTFGVWTYNDTLHVGNFPMQRWTPFSSEQLANRAEDFLKVRPYEKSPKIETVWRPLQAVVRNSPSLMVVIVSTGKQPISGTPFDQELNRELAKVTKDFQKKKTPAVIMLSATAGKPLRYSISPAIGDVKIPLLDVPEVKEVPKPKIANVPPPTPEPVPPTPAPRTATNALVITKEGAKNVPVANAPSLDEHTPTPPKPTARPAAVPIPGLPSNLPETISGPIILKHGYEETREAAITVVPAPAPAPQQSPVTQKQPAVAAQTPVVKAIEPTPTPKPEPVVEAPKSVQLVPDPKQFVTETKLAGSEPAPTLPPVTLKPEESKMAAVTQTKPLPAPEKIISEPSRPEPAPVATPEVASTAPLTAPTTKSEPAKTEVAVTAQATPVESSTPAVVPAEVSTAPLVATTNAEVRRPFPILLAAVGLILVAIVLAFLIGRQTSKRPQQSLVSDWADRDRAKK